MLCGQHAFNVPLYCEDGGGGGGAGGTTAGAAKAAAGAGPSSFQAAILWAVVLAAKCAVDYRVAVKAAVFVAMPLREAAVREAADSMLQVKVGAEANVELRT